VNGGAEESRPRLPRNTWRLVAFMVVLVAAILLLRSGMLGFEWSAQELQRKVSEAGWAGPLLFICGFILLTNMMFPTSIMLLAAGLLFGGSFALAVTIPAALLAYALGYLLSAFFARDTVRGLLERMGWLRILEDIEQRSAFRVSFAARYVPIPVGAQSYLLGLARLPFLPYLLGSLAGSLPWFFIYTQLGASATVRLRAPFWIGLAVCVILVIATDRWWHSRSKRQQP